MAWRGVSLSPSQRRHDSTQYCHHAILSPLWVCTRRHSSESYWTEMCCSVQFVSPCSDSEPDLSETELYRIGAVAKLTGISVECLRAWERRHGLEPAEREGRTRYYSQQQLRRLEKIKLLIEDGHPISSLVELSDEQLDARTGLKRPKISPHRLPQIGLVGPNLLILEQEAEQSELADVAQRWVGIDDFVGSRPAERAQLDVVAVQIPSLSADALQRVQRAAPDCRLLAVYQFASREAVIHATAEYGATTL